MNVPGYHGQYLQIDLSRDQHRVIELSEHVLRKYLGGTGLGIYLLLQANQADVDPLSAESMLAFVFSPLVGSPLTTSAKFAVVGKSPLTDRYNDSLASSSFALAGKGTGHDAILITGRARAPSTLVIDASHVRLQSADDLWGLTVSQTEDRLRQQLGPDFQTAVIGPAGEHRVRFASISHAGRHAGRGGLGAVLGAKNIKAIAVRGRNVCRPFNPTALSTYARQLATRARGSSTAKYRELGTAANLLAFNRLKTLPTRNFQLASFDGAERIAAETLSKSHGKIRQSCAACNIGCEHRYELPHQAQSGRAATPRGAPPPAETSLPLVARFLVEETTFPPSAVQSVRLEYESLFALGSLCGIDDSSAILEATQLCDELGLDTISTGGTVAFAMECAQRGWIDAPWLRFGRGDALHQAIQMIAVRQNLGEDLAEGSRRLAQRLGPDALACAPQIKGLEMPGYEPRSLQTLALGIAVAARGADHNRSGAYEADFSLRVDRRRADDRCVPLAIESEDQAALLDSLILCKFLRAAIGNLYEEAASVLSMITGWDVTPDELRMTAQRIVNARKWFNIQAGWTPSEDTLPERFLNAAPLDDPSALLTEDTLRDLVQKYNLQRNWSLDGWIPESELERLGLVMAEPNALPEE